MQSLECEAEVLSKSRDTLLDKAAFSFAACPVKREAYLTGVTRQMKIHQPLLFFPGHLCVLSKSSSGRFQFFSSIFTDY
jgi:hypothetical protein